MSKTVPKTDQRKTRRTLDIERATLAQNNDTSARKSYLKALIRSLLK